MTSNGVPRTSRGADGPDPDASSETSPDTSLLTTLAQHVRRLRRSRGWTRAELARRSGLSVRFLARVESGEGNISVLRLEALANALGVGCDALVRPAFDATAVVALVGLRGAGKSTVGPLLAARLGVEFVEMDTRILEACGLPLDQLFELHGEAYYRRLERETLGRILSAGRRTVLAAAGGIVNDEVTWQMLREHAVTVWLRAAPEDHWNRVIAQGDRRPMADNPAAMEELRAMHRARESAYGESRWVVETGGREPQGIAAEIEALLVADRESAGAAS
jgi:XRE family aerobic/anaerobic benzoate catabolism transcriptional regulator